MFAPTYFAITVVLIYFFTAGCSRLRNPASIPKVIVLGVDGMDPGFVERHWDALPNLRALRDHGYFGRLATTMPPQSPVAWSTFITGLDPDQHGIYDFVHRNAKTLRLFSSMSNTDEPRFVLPLGPYLLPLSSSHVSSLRRGVPFWRTLAEHGVPVTVQRMPTNYPPESSGNGLAGMGTPDLLGTLGTFTFYSDDPAEVARSVAGGRIVKAHVVDGRALLTIKGPPNPLRNDGAVTAAVITLDVDPTNQVARIRLGDQALILRLGECSPWLKVEFPLIPHLSSVRGMIRIFAKQLHPTLEIYVSPINLDPASSALPISTPSRWAKDMEDDLGPYFTLGIPQDTAALRQGVLTLPQFRQQAQLVFAEEAKLLDYSLRQFTGGFLFFYFSSIDQNSHVLWGRHEDELLKVYRGVDKCIGTVRHQQPDAQLMIISDHGFTTFDRAIHLNAWLRNRGYLTVQDASAGNSGLDALGWRTTQVYAVGLNGLYLNLKGRERFGVVEAGAPARALLARIREQLLAWRDPANGRAPVEMVTETKPSALNSNVAPDLIVGYAPGYRASWQTGLGGVPIDVIEENNDAWIGDHCVNPAEVPGVLFSSLRIRPQGARLQDITALVLARFGIGAPEGYNGHVL